MRICSRCLLLVRSRYYFVYLTNNGSCCFISVGSGPLACAASRAALLPRIALFAGYTRTPLRHCLRTRLPAAPGLPYYSALLLYTRHRATHAAARLLRLPVLLVLHRALRHCRTLTLYARTAAAAAHYALRMPRCALGCVRVIRRDAFRISRGERVLLVGLGDYPAPHAACLSAAFLRRLYTVCLPASLRTVLRALPFPQRLQPIALFCLAWQHQRRRRGILTLQRLVFSRQINAPVALGQQDIQRQLMALSLACRDGVRRRRHFALAA